MACFATRRITIVFIASSFLSFEAIAWQTGDALARRLVHRRAVSRRAPSCLAATVAKQEQADESSSSEDEDKIPTVRVAAVCGLDSLEMNLAAEIVQHSCHALGFGCDLDKALLLPAANASQKMLGPTGRIVVLQFPSQVEQDTLEALNEMIAARVDQDLYSDSPRLQDPFFLRFELNHDEEEDMPSSMSAIIEQAVQEGELRVPLDNQASDSSAMKPISFLPSQVVQVDGAWIQEPNNQNDDHARTWDTSSIHVFDGLVSPNLRKRLAQVIGGGKDLMGKHVPDPARWERGGLSDKLLDVCNNNDDDDTSSTASSSSSYGLTYEAIEEVCYRPHDAIQEMESIISNLFPDFIVTRLPEAVFGLAVSPLTANAPVYGDVFAYHIDADPYVTPPSLWTDIYGRYPNRSTGKPRFVSFLVYLNDEWHDDWGGLTRFLDVATDTEFAVMPRPGRCVVMDQDVSHCVTAPKAAADRPRYSLVWKLVLHPTRARQDMRNLTAGRKWPASILLGSAKKEAKDDSLASDDFDVVTIATLDN